MLTPVIVTAACLVAVDTGLRLRRLTTQTRSQIDIWFPALAALAPLVTGVAIAQALLLALITRWPMLAHDISGPLLVIYGFVCFQNSLAVLPLSAVSEGLPHQAAPTPHAWKFSDVPLRVGLGMQLGLLLCAVGARDLLSLLGCLMAAVFVSTVSNPIVQPVDIRSTLLRCVTGACSR